MGAGNNSLFLFPKIIPTAVFINSFRCVILSLSNMPVYIYSIFYTVLLCNNIIIADNKLLNVVIQIIKILNKSDSRITFIMSIKGWVRSIFFLNSYKCLKYI